MHLAICDDHIADRKQMERLLGRESDRRIPTTGVLYVDSFGSKESILTAPMIYDALFMDMTEDGCDAVELANMLRADGTFIPIVFCCGRVDYRKSPGLPDQVLFWTSRSRRRSCPPSSTSSFFSKAALPKSWSFAIVSKHSTYRKKISSMRCRTTAPCGLPSLTGKNT